MSGLKGEPTRLILDLFIQTCTQKQLTYNSMNPSNHASSIIDPNLM